VVWMVAAWLVSIVQPGISLLIIAVSGLFVGFVLVSLYLPIFSLADTMGAQISGVVRDGAIYGSISVFYNGRFESLYLIRNSYDCGTLPPYQALNLWFVRRIYLIPFWTLIGAWLVTLWIVPYTEKQARMRLGGQA